MPASKNDFIIEQGASRKITIIYKDADGNPIDLSNWCARLTWKTNANTTTVFVSGHDSYDYKFTIDGPNGKITILFPSDTTNSYTFNTAKYDLELQSPENFYTVGGKYTIRLLYGTITITKRYSQSNTELDCQT